METVSLILPQSKKEISVSVDRKKMKTCRLKVYPDQSVTIAVPYVAPLDWIEGFLNDKSSWIEKKLEQFKATVGYASTNEIRNGQSIKMFGEDLIFCVSYSPKNYIYREGRNICIGSIHINDQEKLMQQFEK